MLKWLVTKGGPGSPPSSREKGVLTDDPLATLSRNRKKHEPIYAVSRVNPIFEEEESRIPESFKSAEKNYEKTDQGPKSPDSPNADRESIRSSGYGSKEADSVSYKSESDEDELYGEQITSNRHKKRQRNKNGEVVLNVNDIKLNLKSPGTVAELRRSFENISEKTPPLSQDGEEEKITVFQNGAEDNIDVVEIGVVYKNPNFVKSIEIGCPPLGPLEIIPESNESDPENFSGGRSSWPRVSHLAQALQRQADRIHQRRERERLKKEKEKHTLRFNPLVSVVAQNSSYVTAINVSPKDKIKESTSGQQSSQITQVPIGLINGGTSSYFSDPKLPTGGEYPLLSLQPDSLINEDTLLMMNYEGYNAKEIPSVHDGTGRHGVNFNPGELPNFGKPAYSGIYSTLRSNNSDGSYSYNEKDKGHSIYQSSMAKKKGMNTIKGLWEKSGLKTNGRKLLVDPNDYNDKNQTTNNYRTFLTETDRRIMNPAAETVGRMKGGIEPSSNRSSNTYEELNTRGSTPSETYEDLPNVGLDNLAFIDDFDHRRLKPSRTPSVCSRTSYQFQYNPTNFQKRVTQRLQDESTEYNPWANLNEIIVDKISTGSSVRSESFKRNLSDENRLRLFKKNKVSSFPGKAVKEFGLAEKNGEKFQWKSSSIDPKTSGVSIVQITENHQEGSSGGKYDKTPTHLKWFDDRRKLSANFYPHPNGNTLNCGNNFPCQDFTINNRKSQRLLKASKGEERRRRCCSGAVILCSLGFFIAMIFAISWLISGGQKVFGSM